MRKIAAIVLLCLLAFNWYGYRLLIAVMQQKADQRLEAKIDQSDYDESQLIEIRVAMNMPYQQRYTEFERHYGEIEIDGKTYTYVKRKVDGDEVILKCIPNHSRQELRSIGNDLTKANSGNESEQPGKQTPGSFAKNFWSEYDGDLHPFSLFMPVPLNTIPSSEISCTLPETLRLTPHQPPKC